MGFIDEFCLVNPTALREKMAVIAKKLEAGAVVLGERHTCADARAVILDLAAQGRVKKLFLEFWDTTAAPLSLESVTPNGGSAEMVGEFFRKNAGKDLEEDTTFGAFKVKFNFAMGGAKHKSAIPMLDLIRHAVKAGVLLYPYDQYTKDPESPENMKKRNVTMGEVFAKNAKADEAGVVLLVGSAHTNPKKHEGGTAEHTLQALCSVPPDRVFKLKGLPKNPDSN
jgi:hypothetical protein